MRTLASMQPRRLLTPAALLPLLFMLAIVSPAQQRPRFDTSTEAIMPADQTARLIGALPYLQRLQQRQPATVNPYETLAFRQQVLLQVTTASLQLDATMGEIDVEIAETRELQNFLAARRQRTIDLLNLASIGIGGSVGTASAALGLTTHTRASGVLGVIAGSSTSALSVVGLGVRNSGHGELDVPSNMLARLFNLPGDPNNIYPAVIANFMESSAPGDDLTRTQRLLQVWVKVGRIPSPESPAGRQKIARLASRPGDHVTLSIGDLDDRQSMLYDFRARLSFLKRDLAALLDGMPGSPLAVTTPPPS